MAVMLMAVALTALTVPALAESFSLPAAEVTLVVNDDGSVTVTERLTYRFDGSFSGAFREIPLRAGEAISSVGVSEGGVDYRPGGCTELGCSSPAGTFGVRDLGGRIRIVWHYRAADEDRSFTLSYRVSGLAKVYDDVVDLNWKVWGDEWQVPLDRLEASVRLPTGATAGEVRVWGHPDTVRGSTGLGEDGVSPELRASGVPPGRWVEMRVVFPTRLLPDASAATRIPGEGLEVILDEEARFAAQSAAEAARRRMLLWLVAALAVLPGALGALVVYVRFGREPRARFDREYLQEPPSNLSPAEVAGLVSQGRVDERSWVATLFDLIRRGVVRAAPERVEKSTWMGLRTETITDLALDVGGTTPDLTPAEGEVMETLRRVVRGGPVPLSELRERIRTDASANAASYREFRQKVIRALEDGRLLDTAGRRLVQGVLVVVFFALFAGFLLAAWVADRSGSATAYLVVPVLLVNGLVFGLAVGPRRASVRRTREGALESARWEAFRRYLKDFSRLEEAPAISLELWDRYLVYAVALGVAEEVLAAARMKAPPELEEVSDIYWYGTQAGGLSVNAIIGLQSALSGAFAPPSSGGGGGGFSGGGGAGGGGGGGGAW